MTSRATLIKKLVPDNSPDRFKLIYLVLAFLCLIVILSVSLTVVSGLSNKHMIYDVEINSEKIADVLFYTEVESITIYDEQGQAELQVAKAAFHALDTRIRDIFDQLQILKISIYNRHKRVVYSTDKHIVDTIDSANPMLGSALNGTRRSVLLKNRNVVDLVGEVRSTTDVAEVYVPIKHKDGKVIGVVSVYSDVSGQKKAYRHQLVSSIVILTGAVLLISLMSYAVIIRASSELKNAYRMLESIATTDSLTGTFNRRELLSRAEELFMLMQRSRERMANGVGLGLVMLDIDHFKQVNDSYGHLVGDIVLREFAYRVGGVLRQYDVLGRYGGEEFLILLPNTSVEEVRQVAERILDTVRDQPFRAGELSIAVTTSVGATWTDAHKESFDNSISRADELLYQAKGRGRNQIALSL